MLALNDLHDVRLVVAHPDDEVLWFSSILEHASRAILCFQQVPSRPDWSNGRERIIAEFPRSIESLRLTEAEVFATADWPNPTTSDYGLEVRQRRNAMPGFSKTRYQENFHAALAQLRVALTGSSVVFSHSPWGEYGHEEHVQIFRVVDALRLELGFRLFVPLYVSNKSYGLFLRYLPHIMGARIDLLTNRDLATMLRDLYSKHGCWTWFKDYEWPEREHFVEWTGMSERLLRSGALVQMNMLHMNWAPLARRWPFGG